MGDVFWLGIVRRFIALGDEKSEKILKKRSFIDRMLWMLIMILWEAIVDSIDLHIIEALQANARTSNAELARDLNMAPSAVLERIRKLEQKGVLMGYEARIAPREVGLSLTAFVFVRAEERTVSGKTGVALAQIPEVQEVHHVAGEDCYFVKVRVRDTEDLSRVLQHQISTIKSVRGTRTTIVLSTVKETARLSLAEFSKGLGEVME